MLRLIILCLVLTARVASQEVENDASGDGDGDEEVEMFESSELGRESPDRATADSDGFPTVFVVAAVCVVALVAVAIAAAILIRRRMQNRQQGVYSVPVDQSEKAAI